MSYNSDYTGEQLDEAIVNRHEKNKDTFMDFGGPNQVSAADVKTAVDNIGRDVVIGTLADHHSSPVVVDGAGESALLTPVLTLKANSRYLIELFIQFTAENTEPLLSLNDTGIEYGILYSAEDSSNNYVSIISGSALALPASGSDKLEARFMYGQLVTGTDPELRFTYEYDGNPGGNMNFYYFSAKFTEVLSAEEQ